MTEYDYGNARLRARRAALLRRDQYAGLLGRNLPGLLAALAETCYRPQAEAAASASGGQLELLYRMARDHMAAALAGVTGFYRDQAGEVVAALIGRFDVHNVLMLLRTAHHGGAEAVAGAALLPAGRLDERTAREAAGQPDLPAAARLLAGRRLPDPGSAATLRAAAHRYEIDTSLAAVEHAVVRSARAHQLRALTEAGPAAEPAAAALQRETDDLNLLLALRMREAADGQAAGNPPDTTGPPYLPGGNIPGGQLAAVQHAPARADVLAAVTQGPARWQPPLATWAEGGDLAALHADLEAERLRAEFRLLLRADPLGAAAAVYHVLANQAQARNIRLLAQAAAGAIGHDAARRHLITPI